MPDEPSKPPLISKATFLGHSCPSCGLPQGEEVPYRIVMFAAELLIKHGTDAPAAKFLLGIGAALEQYERDRGWAPLQFPNEH